jgi:hypothetical protein
MGLALATGVRAADCDRACLIGITDAYLAAMVAHDPAKAPLSPKARFTENTQSLPVGQGSAWESATGVRNYKIHIADPDAGQVALYTVIDGKERPGLLTLRLKVEHKLITEVESVFVGVGLRGFANVDNLTAAAPIWSEVLPPAKRRTRAQMVAIVERYFDTLEKQYKDHIPFTDDCLRVENGVITAGNPKAQGIGAMSCRENLNQNIWSYISAVSPRRYTTVDVERGLVSGMFMFHHGGTKTTYVNDKGEAVPFGEAMLKKQAVIISELFKVEDGRIRRIEAVMTGNLPLEAGPGWNQ